MTKRVLPFLAAVLVTTGCSVLTRPCVTPCADGEVCVAGLCVKPVDPEPEEAPGPVCPLVGQSADPSTWCGCWEKSGRTDGKWKYAGDCAPKPKTCADVTCPADKPECSMTEVGPVCFALQARCESRPGPACGEGVAAPCWETSSARADLCSYVCEDGERSEPVACSSAPIERPAPAGPPEVPDWEMTGVVDVPAEMWKDLERATERWVTAHPEKTRDGGAALAQVPECSPRTDACGPARAAQIAEAYDGIALELWAAGVWGGQPRTRDGGRIDKIAVQQRSDPRRFEYYGLLEYGGARFGNARSLDGVWVRGAASAECEAPLPLKTWPDGSAHYFLQCKENGDCTPIYRDEYDAATDTCHLCKAWEYERINGQARCGCPLGLDKSAGRLCREGWIGGGWVSESRAGAQCGVRADNPLWLTGVGDGNCRLCSREEPKVCGPWV